MRRAAAAAVCALLLASAARGEDRFADRESAISLGGGLAYEFVGVNLALRRKNFEGYLGLGLLSVLPGVAIGGRYYLRPDGTGFFFALNLAGHADNIRIDQTDSAGSSGRRSRPDSASRGTRSSSRPRSAQAQSTTGPSGARRRHRPADGTPSPTR